MTSICNGIYDFCVVRRRTSITFNFPTRFRNFLDLEEFLFIYSLTINPILFVAGNFFGSHFIMGGEKFETMQPEAYLFGENTDLNFLGPKPFDVS